MIYEKKNQPLVKRKTFILRVTRALFVTIIIILFGLGFGISGYMITERMAFVDALLNASMILGGMGPVGELHSTEGKVFASFYALFSGLLFISVTGIIAAPMVHRILHAFHAEER